MFKIITAAKPTDAPLASDTRAAVIRAGLYSLATGCRDLPVVLPEMSQVQRCQLRLSLCEAVGEIDMADERAAAVMNVASARRVDEHATEAVGVTS